MSVFREKKSSTPCITSFMKKGKERQRLQLRTIEVESQGGRQTQTRR